MKNITATLAIAAVLLLAIPPIHGKAALMVASPYYSQGDILKFENISVEQGLSQSTVTAILQDQRGFMWFGTEGGLNKYDGYQFTVYKHDPDRPQSLVSNVVTAIYEDRNGQLWIGTSNGLDRLDRETDSFIHYQQEFSGPEDIHGMMVLTMIQDRSGTLWVGTDGEGLAALDLQTKQVRLYKHQPADAKALSSDAIRSLYEDRDGVLWIGTDLGLDRFDAISGAFTHPSQDISLLNPIQRNPVYAIHEDEEGALWLGTKNGLFQWNPATHQFNQYGEGGNHPGSLSNNTIRSIVSDSQGSLWVGTRNGLNQFDPSRGQFIRYRHNPIDAQSLISDSIRSIYEDRSGVLWIGTASGGLSKYARASHKFSLYRNDPTQWSSLSDNNIWSVYEDHKGTLWVGTFSAGLNRVDRNSGTVTEYVYHPADSTSLSANDIRAIFEDHENNLWIGTEHGGLNKLDPLSGIFTRYQHRAHDPDSLSSDSVFAILEDSRHRLWIGTEDEGLDLFDRATGIFSHYHNDPSDPYSISNNDVRTILEDNRGVLWVGTFGGLNRFDENTNRFTVYKNNPQDPASLSNDLVLSLLQDVQGALWVGTFGGGLNRFDPATQTFTHYTEKQGLPDETIYGILAGPDGTLWLSTNKGISKFDPRRSTFQNYDVSDGLQGNQFNPGAYFQGRHGELFFGGTQGLNAFFPDQVRDNPVPPAVVITAFQKFNRTVQTGLDLNDSLHLSYRDNFISFEFAALDYSAPNKNRYAYKLEGFDQDWIQAGTRHYASYTNLPGGRYIFRVKASNSDGTWNESGAAIPVIITPPVWKTWWFNSSLMVVLAVLVAGGFRWRLNLIHERNIQLEHQVYERTSELLETNKLLEKEVEQRKRAETELARRSAEELQKSEARFEAAFKSSAIGMGLLSLEGKILQANEAVLKMSGYTEQELIGRYDQDQVYPEDRTLGRELFEELLEDKRDSYQVEKRYIRKNGEVFWTRLTLSVVRDSHRKPVYLVGLIDDIHEQKKALAHLIESEERFRAMFDTATVGITLIAPDRRVLAVNPAVIRMSGYSEAEMLRMTGLDITHPEDMQIGNAEFAEILAGKREACSFEKRYVRKDGVVYWTRLSISAVRDAQGKLLYLVAITEDIDQQKQALENLRESEARFRSMFEHSAIGIGVMGLDHRILDANPSLCRIYGRTRQEMIALNASEVTYPDDDLSSQQLFKELVNGLRDSYEMDCRYIRKNGEVFWAHVTMSSVRGVDSTPLYLVGMVLDINEQKHAAEELYKSQAQFQAIFDNVAVGVAVMTLGRRPIAFNTATERIIGYNAEEMRNIDPRLLAVPEDRFLDTDLFRELIEGKRDSYVMERRYRHKDGRIFWARINYSLVRDLSGQPDYLIGIIEDIDEQKRAAERLAEQEADYLLTLQHRVNERTHALEQANQRLQQEIQQRIKIEQELAAKAAEEAVTADRTRLARDLHDAVTQTLFSASLTAEVLPDLWEMDVYEAKKSTEELRQLTRGALAEMRTLLLELRPATLTQTRLSDLIKQLCEAFIGRSRLPIKMNIQGDCPLPPEVQVAVYRIAQESLNNVFKYARATQVDVNLIVLENKVYFETCDNGIGFDMSMSKPTSLGMRIMRERAEAIGADFQITSAPGAGTCVSLTWAQDPNVKLKVL